jgi:flagellar basal body-associated protein FliL
MSWIPAILFFVIFLMGMAGIAYLLFIGSKKQHKPI